MKLFTVGPTQMHPRTLEVAGRPVPYFRNQAFSDVVLDCERLLLRDVHAAAGSRALLLTSSGTGAMEAVVINCLTPQDRAIVIDGGTFGHRFVELCALHDIPYHVVELPFGEELTSAHLEPLDAAGYTALLVNIDETSTGQLYDLDLLADFARRNHLLLIVDAISSFAADPLDMGAAGVDALIVSSQKALALSPGLSLVVLSPRLLERVEQAQPKSMYFDLKDYLRNADRGQTPFTPAVGIVYELQDRLHAIEEAGGIEAEVERVRVQAQDFRRRLAGTAIAVGAYPKSNAVTLIRFEKPIAAEVNRRLAEEHGFVLNPCGGAVGASGLRVAHIGDLTLADNEALVAALIQVVAELSD